jgi:hypothetical protein
MNLVCLIGDIVQSRESVERNQLQARLQATLSAVNRQRRKSLMSPCTITLGDEFQAVYREAGFVFNDCWAVLESLHPVKARFSVGIGSLSTPVNPERAIGMDGPAFHAARAGLTELKRTDSLFRITDSTGAVPPWINLALDLISHLSRSWKKSRLFIFQRLLQEQEAKAIATAAGLSAAAVYKNIQHGALLTVQPLLGEISLWVNNRLDER